MLKEAPTMSFQDNLQYLRAQRNFTQERLAMLLGVSRQAISKWESGVSQSYIYHINPTGTFAQRSPPEGWISR